METIKHPSSKCTQLNDRVLWYDGDSTILNDQVLSYFAKHGPTSGLFVDEVTDELVRYNRLVSVGQQLRVKENVNGLLFDWNLPPEYADLNIEVYVQDRMWDELERYGWIGDGMTKDGADRIMRTKMELELYELAGLTDVIRTLIYIINTLQSKNVVWGVGRGSSVSSYVLYLIGVHDVDSVQYGLEITDFLRPNDVPGE